MTQDEEKKFRKSVVDSVAEVLEFVCAEAKMISRTPGGVLGKMAAIMWSAMYIFISSSTDAMEKEKSKTEFLRLMGNSCTRLLKEIDRIESVD